MWDEQQEQAQNRLLPVRIQAGSSPKPPPAAGDPQGKGRGSATGETEAQSSASRAVGSLIPTCIHSDTSQLSITEPGPPHPAASGIPSIPAEAAHPARVNGGGKREKLEKAALKKAAVPRVGQKNMSQCLSGHSRPGCAGRVGIGWDGSHGTSWPQCGVTPTGNTPQSRQKVGFNLKIRVVNGPSQGETPAEEPGLPWHKVLKEPPRS